MHKRKKFKIQIEGEKKRSDKNKYVQLKKARLKMII